VVGNGNFFFSTLARKSVSVKSVVCVALANKSDEDYIKGADKTISAPFFFILIAGFFLLNREKFFIEINLVRVLHL
jgi:hypothetical protein